MKREKKLFTKKNFIEREAEEDSEKYNIKTNKKRNINKNKKEKFEEEDSYGISTKEEEEEVIGKQKLNNRINFWITLIKEDLSGNSEENISKIVKNESKFLKEIIKIETKNKNIKLNSNKIKNSSFDEISDQRENNSNYSFRETNIPYINSINIRITN